MHGFWSRQAELHLQRLFGSNGSHRTPTLTTTCRQRTPFCIVTANPQLVHPLTALPEQPSPRLSDTYPGMSMVLTAERHSWNSV